ncbi:hypothetical protein ATKI12_2685 [Kitasatospora sp. Ki12]
MSAATLTVSVQVFGVTGGASEQGRGHPLGEPPERSAGLLRGPAGRRLT